MRVDRVVSEAMSVVLVLLSLCSLVSSEIFQGRHVCMQSKQVTQPVPTRQSYTRRVYRKDLQRTTYQIAYRNVFRLQIKATMVPGCCNGWKKRSQRDTSCLKPVCSEGCENGGRCYAPGLCYCDEGYTGHRCQIDIDECSGRHLCQQTCTNLPGSYECSCQEGFKLSEDKIGCSLCLTCSKEFQAMQSQIIRLATRVDELEEDKEVLRNNLTSAVSQYEAAFSALHHQEVTTPVPPTSSPGYGSDMEAMGGGGDHMPLDRLASLSQQISILEERMADCACNQDYYLR